MDPQPSSTKALLAALARYAEARGRLLQMEAREAGGQFAVLLVLAVACGCCLLAGWLVSLPALVWWLAGALARPWPQMAFALAAMHLAAGLLALVILRRRLRRLAVLEETFRQFDKDRAWLRGNTPES
jgi:uncharacterized membrane protein YqjE